MSKPTIEEQIEALAWLRKGWNGDNSERAIEAFNTLDDGDVFAALDEASLEREALRKAQVAINEQHRATYTIHSTPEETT